MSTTKMVDTTAGGSSDLSCSSCAKLKEALEASKKEHSLTLRMVKEKIISTDELIRKYQQKCHESDKHHQQATDTTLKLEAAQMKIETLQSQLDRSLNSSEPLRKNVARLHREKSLADSTISELREKLQSFEKTNTELLSTTKVKEEQECAWRLEKQLQAHEMQKQKKSLQKSEGTIAKLQEQLKKEKEQIKELKLLLSQAKRKTTKLEKDLEKSKEEIQSVKLDAEFAKLLGDDAKEKTPKRRQQRKATKTPQIPKEPKQICPSSPNPNHALAHVIEELTVLSDMGPALSPLPPSPDRETLEYSSGSEDESGSGSGSEDDGNASDDGGNSDYSLGDLADMLVGDHNEDEKLGASPIKTRSHAKDVCENMEDSLEEVTKTNTDTENGKIENESSMGHAANEDVSVKNYVVDNSNGETVIQRSDIEIQINEDSHKINRERCNTEKRDDESDNSVKLPKAEKAKKATPQRKEKRNVASPKPRVMTRSRAKAMKLSSSSDADSSSERGTGEELKSTTMDKMSDTYLKRNSKSSKVGNLEAGRSENDGNTPVDTKSAFNESLKVSEPQKHVEEKSKGGLSNTPSSDSFDVIYLHGNVSEPISSEASLSVSEEQVGGEDSSNVFSEEIKAVVTHHHSNDGECSNSTASFSDLEPQVADENISNVNLAKVEDDASHHHSNEDELDNSITTANKDNSLESLVSGVVEAATNVSTKLEKENEMKFSATFESVSSAELDVTHRHSNNGGCNHSTASLSDLDSQVTNENISSVNLAEVNEEFSHHHRNETGLDSSIANEDNVQVSSVSEMEANTNISTEPETDNKQELSATLESGSGIKDEDSFNIFNVEKPVILSPEHDNEKSEITLSSNTTNVTNTEKGETSQESETTTHICGDILMSQLQTKKDVSEQIDKPLEENNNNILEELESEKLEPVDGVLVVNSDSYDQAEPVLQEIQEHSRSDLSETSTTCVGSKNQNRAIYITDSSSEVENRVESLCDVSCKETSTSSKSLKNETTDIGSSSIQVGFEPLTMICEKETCTKTTEVADTATTAIETTELVSTENTKDTSEDSNSITQRDELLPSSEEAVQDCSIDEPEVRSSEGHHTSAQDEIYILTAEPTTKKSDLQVPSSRNEISEGSSIVSEVEEDSVLEREMPIILINDGEDFFACEEEGKHSGCTGVAPSKTMVEETREPSTSNKGKRHSDLGRNLSFSAMSKEGSATSIKKRKRSDCGKDIPDTSHVSKPSTFNKGKRPLGSKRDKSYARTEAQETKEKASPASSMLDAEKSEIERIETTATLSLSANEAVLPDDSSAVHDTQDDSHMKDLLKNLEFLLDDFPALSPLPPSPCPSDDESFPASHTSSTDLNTESSYCTTNFNSAKRSLQTPGPSRMKLNQTVNFTEITPKSVKRTSLVNATTSFTTRASRTDMLVKNVPVKDKTSWSESTPCTRGSASIKHSLPKPLSTPNRSENASLKRSYQQTFSESAKDKNVVSQIKKMKRNSNVPQKQQTSNLEKRLDTTKATGKTDSLKQLSPKNSGVNNRPVPVDSIEPILAINDELMEEDNDGPTLKEALAISSKSAKAADDKQSKCARLSVRPGRMPEVKYVIRCLNRVYEDNVKLLVVVERFTSKRCISSSTPVASSIVQFLKEREDDLMSQILDQLEQFHSDNRLNDWKPVYSGFESRLLELVSLLSSNTLFENLIPQLVTLCSRSLMTDCCNFNSEEMKKGDLSLCRVFTALCQFKQDLGCARTVCYDIIRSLYAFQDAALELIVSMVTVWPEVLKTSSDCFTDEKFSLVRTLKSVLLYWTQKSSSTDLGNILRVLCCWGDDLVTEEELKELGLQLIKRLHERSVASVSIGKDRSIVLDRYSFNIVKSLELLSCVLGWQWTLNELIINNIWRILKSWADEETGDEETKEISESETCCGCRPNVCREKISVAPSENEKTSDGNSSTAAGEKEADNKQLRDEDVCSTCGKLTGNRLPESQIVLCVQLLGILCRIAIENGQSLVPEIMDLLCGLIEETSPDTKVTYAIQVASATSLLDISPWQPERVALVLGKWITALKESGSSQAPASVAQGLVCLKSILRTNQI